MQTLFSPDSPLIRTLTRVADVMLLNFLFIVTSIPLVTLGASLTALNFTAMRIATDKCGSVTSDYFRSFRQNFRQATAAGFVLVLLTAVLAAWYAVITNLPYGAAVEFGLLAIWYILVFNFAAAALFVFPYLANFDGRVRDVFRNARLLSWKHPFAVLGTMAVIALSVIVTVFYPQTTGYGLLWLLIGFAGVATVNGFMFAAVFKTYIAAEKSPAR